MADPASSSGVSLTTPPSATDSSSVPLNVPLKQDFDYNLLKPDFNSGTPPSDPAAPPLPKPAPEKKWTPEQLEAIRQKKDHDANWLFYGYQEQMESRSSSNGTSDNTNNLYLQLSSDKYLAQIAGIPYNPPKKDEGDPSTLTPRTGSTDPKTKKNSASLRDDSSSKDDKDGDKKKSKFLHNDLFKPAIHPITASRDIGLGNINGLTPDTDLQKLTIPDDKSKTDVDSLSLETPGLTAARKDPSSTRAAWDSNLELLPGESIDHALAHQDPLAISQPPTGSSITQLQNQQKNILNPPVAPGFAQTAPPIALSPLVTMPDLTPNRPAAPTSTPAHPRIADPRDFLDR